MGGLRIVFANTMRNSRHSSLSGTSVIICLLIGGRVKEQEVEGKQYQVWTRHNSERCEVDEELSPIVQGIHPFYYD